MKKQENITMKNIHSGSKEITHSYDIYLSFFGKALFLSFLILPHT